MMHKALHLRDHKDKLCQERKKDDCVDLKIQGLKEYTRKSKERLVTAANNSNINKINLTTNWKTTNKKSTKQK